MTFRVRDALNCVTRMVQCRRIFVPIECARLRAEILSARKRRNARPPKAYGVRGPLVDVARSNGIVAAVTLTCAKTGSLKCAREREGRLQSRTCGTVEWTNCTKAINCANVRKGDPNKMEAIGEGRD